MKLPIPLFLGSPSLLLLGRSFDDSLTFLLQLQNFGLPPPYLIRYPIPTEGQAPAPGHLSRCREEVVSKSRPPTSLMRRNLLLTSSCSLEWGLHKKEKVLSSHATLIKTSLSLATLISFSKERDPNPPRLVNRDNKRDWERSKWKERKDSIYERSK